MQTGLHSPLAANWRRQPGSIDLPAPPKHRQSIVDASVTLFRRNGYAGTGLADIVEASGAPKGSLYHYFPAGKASIAVAAVVAAGRRVADTLADLAAGCATAGDMLIAHAALLAGWMKASGFRDGCPIATVLLELAPEDSAVTHAGREVHRAWIDIVTARLAADGHAPERARRLAVLAVSAIQGALIQSRVECSGEPIMTVAEELRVWLDGDVVKASSETP